MTVCEWWWGGYVASTDPGRLDPRVTRRCLGAAPRRCGPASGPQGDGGIGRYGAFLGLYDGERQVGFVGARVDARRRSASVGIVVPGGRRSGPLCRWLAEVAGSHPELCGMRLDVAVSSAPASKADKEGRKDRGRGCAAG